MPDLRSEGRGVGTDNGGLGRKYTVIKEDTAEPLRDGVDCFVIRAQDVFGAQTLFAYANAIQTTLEINDITQRGLLSAEEAEGLRALADNVHALAVLWNRNMSRKIPT